VIARYADPAEDVAQLGIVVEQPQQRFAACTTLAYTEDVFRGRVEAKDKQVPVEQDYARTQPVEDVFCLVADVAVVARRPAAA
jgi:hypothetical protein